jgi:hypothetical protein
VLVRWVTLPPCANPLAATGHTSIDIQAARQQLAPSSTAAASSIRRHQAVPQQPTAQPAQHPGRAAAAAPGSVKLAAAVQPLSVLHVRGKSGLKHTKQLLDCWIQHPEWPQLTVIGPMPNEQISGAHAKRYMAAPNIRVPNPGKQQGEWVDAGWVCGLLGGGATGASTQRKLGAAALVLLVPRLPASCAASPSGVLCVVCTMNEHRCHCSHWPYPCHVSCRGGGAV